MKGKRTLRLPSTLVDMIRKIWVKDGGVFDLAADGAGHCAAGGLQAHERDAVPPCHFSSRAPLQTLWVQ